MTEMGPVLLHALSLTGLALGRKGQGRSWDRDIRSADPKRAGCEWPMGRACPELRPRLAFGFSLWLCGASAGWSLPSW